MGTTPATLQGHARGITGSQDKELRAISRTRRLASKRLIESNRLEVLFPGRTYLASAMGQLDTLPMVNGERSHPTLSQVTKIVTKFTEISDNATEICKHRHRYAGAKEDEGNLYPR